MLNADLLNGYNPTVHPGLNYSEQLLNINVDFSLRKIQTFDELTSTFTIIGVLYVAWFDERLHWTPSSYNNLMVTHFKQKEIWTPPFLLANSHDDIAFIGNDELHISVTYTGKVRWDIPVKFMSLCDADVTYYPSEKQSCGLTLLPWGYSSNLVQLNTTGSTLDTAKYEENSIWTLVSTYQQSNQSPNPGFLMTVTFKRKPMFFVMNFILPTIFMCFINLFVFALPAESGERIGFSITVLLAIAVFLSIVSSNLPQSSSPQIALLCYLLVVHIILSLMMMVCVILGLQFYFRSDEEQVPGYISKLTRIINNKTCGNLKTSDVSPEPQITDSVMTKAGPNVVEVVNDDFVSPTDDVVTWKHVCNAFDKVCFAVFMVTAIVCNVTFLVVIFGS
ncbi:acetylcholine receptor subunit beta-type lev-1-like [Ylistrum balloti]|uniref:acetylcholine receptor subunit beta-type lev-1-like n=1 Tax=Ylistrum balloti TaxID=509963 RepID=UPI002905F3DE|nr:acetylcholine receptor subunit beta-type lev-1-like [Ylistrum balloti]